VRPDVPIELERVILRAMAPSLAERYPTANAMADDLERFAAAEGLFPGPRQLGEFVRGLVPEKAPLARAMEQMPDAKAVARLIDIVGTQDIVVDPPGAAAEKPTRSELAVTAARTQAAPPTLPGPPGHTADPARRRGRGDPGERPPRGTALALGVGAARDSGRSSGGAPLPCRASGAWRWGSATTSRGPAARPKGETRRRRPARPDRMRRRRSE
jgi:hypothetical protein